MAESRKDGSWKKWVAGATGAGTLAGATYLATRDGPNAPLQEPVPKVAQSPEGELANKLLVAVREAAHHYRRGEELDQEAENVQGEAQLAKLEEARSYYKAGHAELYPQLRKTPEPIVREVMNALREEAESNIGIKRAVAEMKEHLGERQRAEDKTPRR